MIKLKKLKKNLKLNKKIKKFIKHKKHQKNKYQEYRPKWPSAGLKKKNTMSLSTQACELKRWLFFKKVAFCF